jgi:hypothetical protein
MAITQQEIDHLHRIVNDKKFFIEGASLYGMKKILFEFLDLPAKLPQSFYLDHGVPLYDKNRKLNSKVLQSRFPLILLTNKDQLQSYQEHIKDKTLLPIGALFPRYRHMHQIELKENRQGTIVFPSHSTLQVDVVEGWTDYARRLKALPDEFHPLTVCLYWLDVLRGRHEIFQKAGFDVITMGHFSRQDFAHEFYTTVRKFKYASSNEYGSYLPYCVEMGLPFFIYGDQFVNQNISQNDFYPDGTFKYSDEMGLSAYEQVRILFAQPDTPPMVTAPQKRFVAHTLGLDLEIDKNQVRAAIKRSQKAHYPKYLKMKMHQLLWDIIYFGPPAFSNWMEKKIKPFYIKQKV